MEDRMLSMAEYQRLKRKDPRAAFAAMADDRVEGAPFGLAEALRAQMSQEQPTAVPSKWRRHVEQEQSRGE